MSGALEETAALWDRDPLAVTIRDPLPDAHAERTEERESRAERVVAALAVEQPECAGETDALTDVQVETVSVRETTAVAVPPPPLPPGLCVDDTLVDARVVTVAHPLAVLLPRELPLRPSLGEPLGLPRPLSVKSEESVAEPLVLVRGLDEPRAAEPLPHGDELALTDTVPGELADVLRELLAHELAEASAEVLTVVQLEPLAASALGVEQRVAVPERLPADEALVDGLTVTADVLAEALLQALADAATDGVGVPPVRVLVPALLRDALGQPVVERETDALGLAVLLRVARGVALPLPLPTGALPLLLPLTVEQREARADVLELNVPDVETQTLTVGAPGVCVAPPVAELAKLDEAVGDARALKLELPVDVGLAGVDADDLPLAVPDRPAPVGLSVPQFVDVELALTEAALDALLEPRGELLADAAHDCDALVDTLGEKAGVAVAERGPVPVALESALTDVATVKELVMHVDMLAVIDTLARLETLAQTLADMRTVSVCATLLLTVLERDGVLESGVAVGEIVAMPVVVVVIVDVKELDAHTETEIEPRGDADDTLDDDDEAVRDGCCDGEMDDDTQPEYEPLREPPAVDGVAFIESEAHADDDGLFVENEEDDADVLTLGLLDGAARDAEKAPVIEGVDEAQAEMDALLVPPAPLLIDEEMDGVPVRLDTEVRLAPPPSEGVAAPVFERDGDALGH